MKKNTTIACLLAAAACFAACNSQHALNCDGKEKKNEELQALIASGYVEKIATFITTEEGFDFDMDACCLLYRTPLQYAVNNGNRKVTQFFLNKGADPNKKDHSGTTALMTAVEKGQIKMVKLLLNYGADPALTNNRGQTALEIAQLRKRRAVIKLLEKKQEESTKKPEYEVKKSNKSANTFAGHSETPRKAGKSGSHTEHGNHEEKEEERPKKFGLTAEETEKFSQHPCSKNIQQCMACLKKFEVLKEYMKKRNRIADSMIGFFIGPYPVLEAAMRVGEEPVVYKLIEKNAHVGISEESIQNCLRIATVNSMRNKKERRMLLGALVKAFKEDTNYFDKERNVDQLLSNCVKKLIDAEDIKLLNDVLKEHGILTAKRKSRSLAAELDSSCGCQPAWTIQFWS